MINKLHIQNFQSWEDVTFEFHPGVNVLIGSSNKGKSAVVRALYWASHNKPSGDGFRSHWGGDTIVRTTYPEGWAERSKCGKTKNQYRLQTKGNEVEIFNSFNQTVPEEIAELINMDDLNWHLQMGSPFLLSEHPGKVAKYLNSIVNLDVIDRTVSNINRQLRQVQQDVRARKQQIKEFDEELESADFELIPELERDLEKLKADQKELGLVDQDVHDLKGVIQDINTHQEKLDSLPDVDIEKARKDLEGVQRLIDREDELAKAFVELNNLLADIDQQEQSIELLTADIERQEKDYVSEIGDRCPLCDQEIK